MTIIGIDPGLTGAVAVLFNKKFVNVYDTPTKVVKKSGGRKKRVYVISEMVTLLDELRVSNPDAEVIIENQRALNRPGFAKQGVSSTFQTGMGFGIWLGIIEGLKLPLHRVEARSWKEHVGIASGSPKAASLTRARKLFPAASLKRVMDHGRADALLIAYHLASAGKTQKPA